MRWSGLSIVLLLVALVLPGNVRAQVGTSLGLDPSIRSAGMGNATTSVFWGDDPNYWANPALLGYHKGIRYEWSKTQLVPDLADDVFFESSRMTFGAWGVGLAVSGKPFRLDYGESEATDSQGNSLGTFNSYEEIDSWGIGVNVVELSESIARLFVPELGSVARYADVSLGHMKKDIVIDLAPGGVLADPGAFGNGRAEAETKDFGVQVRATPWNAVDYEVPEFLSRNHPSFATMLEKLGGLRLDGTYGKSWLNYDDAEVVFIPGQQPDAIAQVTRWGAGFQISTGLPKSVKASLEASEADWLVAMFTPLVSFGMAWDRSKSNFDRGAVEVRYSGWELTFLNVVTIRRGSIDNPTGDVVDSTEGWGLGVRLGDVAGFRWDEATIPQATSSGKVDREGLMAFVDVVALAAVLR